MGREQLVVQLGALDKVQANGRATAVLERCDIVHQAAHEGKFAPVNLCPVAFLEINVGVVCAAQVRRVDLPVPHKSTSAKIRSQNAIEPECQGG